VLKGEYITQGQRRAVPSQEFPVFPYQHLQDSLVPVAMVDHGKEDSSPSSPLDPKALGFAFSKLMMPHPPAQESIGLLVGLNGVIVLGRERNTKPGHGTVFSNQIPNSKSNHLSCLRQESHPE